MSKDSDQARNIADRVSRRVKGKRETSPGPAGNNAPVSEELSALRAGLHDLQSKLDRIESKIVHGAQPGPQSRARVIDFVSSSPPVAGSVSITHPPSPAVTSTSEFVPATQSPWLRNMMPAVDHPSQERFGVEEATVAELVEFFESEKKCSMEPGGKPCDHCSACNSRGF